MIDDRLKNINITNTCSVQNISVISRFKIKKTQMILPIRYGDFYSERIAISLISRGYSIYISRDGKIIKLYEINDGSLLEIGYATLTKDYISSFNDSLNVIYIPKNDNTNNEHWCEFDVYNRNNIILHVKSENESTERILLYNKPTTYTNTTNTTEVISNLNLVDFFRSTKMY